MPPQYESGVANHSQSPGPILILIEQKLLFSCPKSSFRAAPSCLTTAIGCFRQNSCSCGLNASFLFSKNTDGVGGWSCSRVSRVGGQSGGQGGGASADRTEQTAGTSFSSPACRCLRTSCWMSFADIEILKSPPTEEEEEEEEEDDDPSKPPLEGEGSFSSFTTGSSLMSGWCCCLLPVSSCRFAPLPAAAAVVVEVASAFIGGDLVLLVVVEGSDTSLPSPVGELSCLSRDSAKVALSSRMD
uniref:Uncharacterized protein n=1 Tax=Anopheles melas TaxID=34690 RepID=A0A182U5Y5_9DIPT